MHFSASRTLHQRYRVHAFVLPGLDQNDPTRVFQNFVEYQIDYNDPFTENQGWTPVDNWSYLSGIDVNGTDQTKQDLDPISTTVTLTDWCA